VESTPATTTRYVFWQDGETWLGYLEEFPDYWTQGADREDLQEHLKDLYKDLTSGEISNVRRVASLPVG
jgi:predicted RNase H-like HicB family nuclease